MPSRGFGMVELMIAITLSIMIGAAVIQTFLGSKNSYRFQDALAEVQENGRFAITQMTQDIRMAGFLGCGNIDAIPLTNIVKNIDTTDPDKSYSVIYSPATILKGYNNVIDGNDYGAVAGTDVLIVRKASGVGARLAETMASTTADIKLLGNNLNAKQGDVLLITDCKTAHVFRASAVSAPDAAGNVTISHAASTFNASGEFIYDGTGKKYQPDAEVLAFESVTYSVRDTGRTTPGNQKILSLFVETRGPNQGGPATLAPTYVTELVEGVQDMQLEYGIDNSADGVVDMANVYVDAAGVTDWSKVVSVRINLLMQSTHEGLVAKTGSGAYAQTLLFPLVSKDGEGAAVAADGRLHQVFYTVAGIRNRLP
jgi:type IV pilus assembly protein PilW